MIRNTMKDRPDEAGRTESCPFSFLLSFSSFLLGYLRTCSMLLLYSTPPESITFAPKKITYHFHSTIYFNSVNIKQLSID